MISFTLILTYVLLGAPNEIIIPDFENKTDCQIQLDKVSAVLKSQGASVESAICHRVVLDIGR